MNLDILRTEWAARDAKLDTMISINQRLLREVLVEKARGEIRRRIPFGPFSLATWVAIIAMLVVFIAHHAGQWRFLVPAAAILAWTIGMGVVSLRQRSEIAEFDYGQPLVAAQSQLASLRIRRIRAFQWAFLTGQVVWWVPFFIVVFAALGVDLYRSEWMRSFLAMNLAVGVALIPIALWSAGCVGRRFGEHSWVRHFADGVAGSDVAAARAFLRRLGDYEHG